MGLIKAAKTPATLAPFSVRDIEEQAAALLVHAQMQVDKLYVKVDAEAKQIRQNAYDQGFKAGTEDGLKKGTAEGRAAGQQAALAEKKAQYDQLFKSLSAALTDFNAQRQKFEAAAATEVIRLAVNISRRVTKLQGSLDPNVLSENLKAALKLVVQSTDLRIAVHPSQKAFLEETLPQLRLTWPNLAHVQLVEDATLSPGGCKVFTAQGQIDADLDRQIDRIAADLLPAATSAGAA